MAVGDSLLGIFVGGGNDAHVDRGFDFAAEAADFVVFEDAQKFRLSGCGHFADFVEEQGAAVGEFETADAAFRGAGERAFFVAEDFAFHQRFGDRGTVDGDKGIIHARREHVNRTRDHFLAGAGFAGDQNRSGGGRGNFHLAHHVLHRAGGADEDADLAGGAQVAAQRDDGLLIAGVAEGAFDERAQYRRFQRFFDVPVGAGFDGLDDAFIAAAAGDDDDRDTRDFFAELGEQVEAVHAGKLDVGENQVGLVFLKFGEGFFAAAHAENFPIPFAQQRLITFASVVFVFDDQDALDFGRFSGHLRLNLSAVERKSKPVQARARGDFAGPFAEDAGLFRCVENVNGGIGYAKFLAGVRRVAAGRGRFAAPGIDARDGP